MLETAPIVGNCKSRVQEGGTFSFWPIWPYWDTTSGFTYMLSRKRKYIFKKLHVVFKGTVQRKLTGDESDINWKVFLLHWTADIYFLNFKGTYSLNSKKLVSAAKAKLCGLSNSMGVRCKELIAENQPADNGNLLVVIVSTAVISFLLQFQWSANFHYRSIAVSLLPLQITDLVSSSKCGKIISYKSEWAFCYQFFAAGAPLNWISHIFWLKLLKPFFCDLKSKFPIILKIKYQRFNENGRPLNWYNLWPLLVFAGQYL